MKHDYYTGILVGIVLMLGVSATQAQAQEKCLTCHKETINLSVFHNPDSIGCVACHLGDAMATTLELAHVNLEAYPGQWNTIDQTCGKSGCHADLAKVVQTSLMNTMHGVISKTRRILDGKETSSRNSPDQLTAEGVDDYLRKMCVSCHLGNKRSHHQQTLLDRGGGCAACHLKAGQTRAASQKNVRTGKHPELSLAVDNDRCFGCHSRSGRISLNYVGLAETSELDPKRLADFGTLPDGRLVEKLAPDVHSSAGMACIDCHTADEVMGDGKSHATLQTQLDIQCADCHAPQLTWKPAEALTPRERLYPVLYNQSELLSQSRFIVTSKNKTPLFHVSENSGKRVLTSKITGKAHLVPVMKTGKHHNFTRHQRLSCDSCHSSWVPQCYGCHISQDPDQTQWDHISAKPTPGRWLENAWAIKHGLPALGVGNNQKIIPFIPGMNLSFKHPETGKTISRNLFAAISPHTTRNSRTCKSCHQNDQALGIITKLETSPQNKDWKTPDGWIFAESDLPGKATNPGDRSFNSLEIQKIRQVGKCLECHAETYRDFDSTLPRPSRHP
ncbi:MAG: hypothetical protein HQM11_19640 [SAR324 cluster bacterium]|nr:hypothetical protein [SAR324 cluster bacterium]